MRKRVRLGARDTSASSHEPSAAAQTYLLTSIASWKNRVWTLKAIILPGSATLYVSNRLLVRDGVLFDE